jgi:hypothetical protein
MKRTGLKPLKSFNSGCAILIPMKLSERVFSCEQCSLSIDRDLNAAVNLSGLAASSAESVNACGDGVRHQSSSRDGAAAMNQEMNAFIPNGISG